jgi:pantoate--beta-alanine ligase
MLTVEQIPALQEQLNTWKHQSLQVGLVPTMGALHEGHLSLIRRSVQENDRTVCSIFINPTQFNNAKDLESYPVDLEEDLQMLEKEGCHLAFLPSRSEMYPEGERRKKYDLGGTTKFMEGQFRPGHFQGVATVVDRLFEICRPDRAYFGEKDFQQLAVIRAMAKDVGYRMEIIGCPIVREENGLAMSSRNRRLTRDQAEHALLIHECIQLVRSRIKKDDPAYLLEMVESLFEADPVMELEYVEIADAHTLMPVRRFPHTGDARIFIAAYAGDVRLIDNEALSV